MDSAPTVVPRISISLAPPEEPVAESYSPFSASTISSVDDNAFRHVHLTPPPTLTKPNKPLSPLRPCDDTPPTKGLERERFEALLRISRERNVAFGTKKDSDLRKEIALKTHKNKQVERRALFLSKVLAPPSPTATLTPKTPPDSPAIFHYSLPSPGLISPLAMYEFLNEDPGYNPFLAREPWVEQVDFRIPEYNKAKERDARPLATARAARPLPSLDQISARLSSQSHVRSRAEEKDQHDIVIREPRPRLQTGVGRLRMPVRNPKPALEPLLIAPPIMPVSSNCPDIHITTLLVPRSASISPIKLTESNLFALNSRERRAYDMLSTLRRRTAGSVGPQETGEMDGVDDRKTKWKRHSAPADLLPFRQRSGFEHPILAFPGGF